LSLYVSDGRDHKEIELNLIVMEHIRVNESCRLWGSYLRL